MMKRIYTLLFMLLIMAATYTVRAQESHTFGKNDTTRLIPNNNCWKYSLSEQIFTPEEVGVTGNIEKISFFRDAKTSSSSHRMIQMYIGTTTKNNFADENDWIDPATLTRVFDGLYIFLSDEITIRFDCPFAYDGTENLVICFRDWTGSLVNVDEKVYFQANHDSGTAKAIIAYDDDNNISAPYYIVNSGQKKLSYDRSVTKFTTSDVNTIPTTTEAGLPLSGAWNYCITQQIFTPEEVGGKGTINSLTFHDILNFAGTKKLDIYLCATSRTEFNGNPKLASTWVQESFMTKVFSGNVTFNVGDVTINLSNSFNYNGVNNLVLGVVDKTGSYEHSLMGTMDLKPGEYRTLKAYDDHTQLSFSNPENAAYAYAYPYVNRVTFFENNYGISVNDTYITEENASNFTYGLTSGNIVYDPASKTLTLNNIETNSDYSGDIYCRHHDGDLTIIANGYNNNHYGRIYGADGHTTTLTGDTFDLGCLEIYSKELPATIVIDNTSLLVNLEENYQYAIYGNGYYENLVIKNSYVKSYAKTSNYDEFADIALIDCEIAYPANAVVEGGYITLNGSVIGYDSVVIVPTKIIDGIENVTAKTFSVFPNPAETEVTLYLEPYEGTAHLSIFSADGRMMNVAELPAIDTNYRMDVSTLPAGIYYIAVTTESLRQTATIVKK